MSLAHCQKRALMTGMVVRSQSVLNLIHDIVCMTCCASVVFSPYCYYSCQITREAMFCIGALYLQAAQQALLTNEMLDD